MNNTKTKTFIAFVNKNKKDSFWIDGNYIYEDSAPKIYPYETKEEKDTANLIGFRNTQWDEVEDTKSEIVGVILKVTDETVGIISKDKAVELEQKFYGNSIYETKPKKKKEKLEEVVSETVKEISEKVVEKTPEKVVEKVSENVPEQISSEDAPKKRGRPRKSLVVE